ncbi:MAG: Kelch repeat-containing protein, partial [Micromonosporaceae bacterium]
TSAASLGTARAGHTANLLGNGTVLVTGGDSVGVRPDGTFSPESLGTAERYDPAANRWLPVAAMPGPRTRHRAILLHSGRVLVVGGTTGPGFTAGYRSVVAYDPEADRWSATGALALGRWAHATAELADGRVVTAGGTTRAGAAAPGPDGAALSATTEILTP